MIHWWQQTFARLQHEPGSPPPGIFLQGLATALAKGYGWVARGRRWLYDTGWRQARRLPGRVISIGNLTVGGTGKTPLVAYLARRFQDQGRRVAILSRGYGSQARGVLVVSDGQQRYCQPIRCGDEPYWLAGQLPGIPVLTGTDRYTAGLLAAERFHPDLMLLDDGFQHCQLHRDLDLVLLDAACPLGNGQLLPRGPLREPLSTLRRSLVLVLTRYQEAQHLEQYQSLQAAFPEQTILRASLHPSRVLSPCSGEIASAESLRGQRLLAFAGLAHPWRFAADLQELGAKVVEFHPFPDHYAYDITDLVRLAGRSRQLEAQGLITTEKDWARLGERWELEPPLLVLGLEVELLDKYTMRLGESSLEF
ncbi:MAG: tetraacyldisaccharide 4'-kinase [Desulfobacca sp. 4484_104]|nr:MAG: tetraacyldisaccharide 4'-kinase [Desulfobacca sp. 4484_104]